MIETMRNLLRRAICRALGISLTPSPIAEALRRIADDLEDDSQPDIDRGVILLREAGWEMVPRAVWNDARMALLREREREGARAAAN